MQVRNGCEGGWGQAEPATAPQQPIHLLRQGLRQRGMPSNLFGETRGIFGGCGDQLPQTSEARFVNRAAAERVNKVGPCCRPSTTVSPSLGLPRLRRTATARKLNTPAGFSSTHCTEILLGILTTIKYFWSAVTFIPRWSNKGSRICLSSLWITAWRQPRRTSWGLWCMGVCLSALNELLSPGCKAWLPAEPDPERSN